MFLDELKSQFVSGTNRIIVTADLSYFCPRTEEVWTVPFGFECDAASIPRCAWSIIGHPFDHRWRKESVLHDWFYALEEKPISRKMADLIFYDGLRAKGLRWTKAQAMYRAVRLGGTFAWRKKR